MKACLIAVAVSLSVTALPSAAHAEQDHPFTLVNVIDLFEAFNLGVEVQEVDGGFSQPDNLPALSEARVGTNPSAVATDGFRVWIAGHYNGADIVSAEPATAWYASVGVAEVTDIYGGSFPLPLVRYLDTFQAGPGVANTDWFSGLDYDEESQVLYVAFDDAKRFVEPGILSLLNPPQSGTQSTSYVGAVDTDPLSATYGQFLWTLDEPVPTAVDDIKVRLTGGVTVDPLAPNWISLASFPSGVIFFYDTLNLGNPPTQWQFYTGGDNEWLPCDSVAILNHEYDPTDGHMYVRARNGVVQMPRDLSGQTVPYQALPQYIVEPDGGNGIADTVAAGDDEQRTDAGEPVSAGDEIVWMGPNGVLDTVPAGDEVHSLRVRTDSVVGNTSGSHPGGCPDEDGFLYLNVTQGQGIAFVEADNLVGLEQDLILASSRPSFGANQVADVRFFDTTGESVATLELPCTPPATTSTGISFYDIDYHAPTGTLVVLEYERRMLYVFKAQVEGGPAFPRFDYNRDGDVDLFDYARFQECFTGAEVVDPVLSLNCQRMNSDSDCEIDLDDYAAFEGWLLGPGAGTSTLPPSAPTVSSPIGDGDATVEVTGVGPDATRVTLFADGSPIGTYLNPSGANGTVEVILDPGSELVHLQSITAEQENALGISGLSEALEVGIGNGDILISLGIRESGDAGALGSPGTSTGDFEWIGASTNGLGGAPQGVAISPSADWQTIVFNPATDPVSPFFDLGDGQITESRGILESLAVSVNAGSADRSSGAYTLYVDNVVNVQAGAGGSDFVIADFESYAPGDEVLFQEPTFSGSTDEHLTYPPSTSEISEATGHPGQSELLQWFWKDTGAQRWARITTFGANNVEMPIIDLTKAIRLDILLLMDDSEP